MVYTVQPGDTLSEIAHRYGLTLQELVETNKFTEPAYDGNRHEAGHQTQRGGSLGATGGDVEPDCRAVRGQKGTVDRAQSAAATASDNLYVGQVVYVPVPEASPMLAGNVQLRRQMAQAASRKATTRMRAMDWPVKEATITSGFGMRWGQVHKGLDHVE